jgi:hypothetical protein
MYYIYTTYRLENVSVHSGMMFSKTKITFVQNKEQLDQQLNMLELDFQASLQVQAQLPKGERTQL